MAISGLLLHLCDSAFPTGSYAHSFGLEELVQRELVQDETSLLAFLQLQIRPALCQMELPLLREAHRCAVHHDLDALLEIDAVAGALRLTRESREASRRIGGRRLAVLRKIQPDSWGLNALERAVAEGKMEGHHVVVFATACYELPLRDALAGFYYQTMVGYCTASLKLFRIGQEAVHRVLAQTLCEMERILDQSLTVATADIGWFDPVLDLAAMHHEIATERLFIS